MRPHLVLVCALAAAACSDDASVPSGPTDDAGTGTTCRPHDLRDDQGQCIPLGFAPCPEGFTEDEERIGCVASVASCKDTELPALGGACLAVGSTTCPAGFVTDASGFGCAPSAPTPACTGATREAMTGCVPIGDCNAPFPPPAATYFVDDSYAQNDATHFQTITAALAAAPAGATIAVESGTYVEPLSFTKPVTLVGRCAAQVTLQGTAAATAGLHVGAGVTGVVVRGMRVTGFEPGADVDGGQLDVSEVLFEANRRQGVQVTGGGRLRLERSAVRGSLPDASARFGVGAGAGGGSELVLEDTGIAGNREMGVFLTGSATKGTLRRVRVTSTTPRTAGMAAPALAVQTGATADVAESAFETSTTAGIGVTNGKATIRTSAVAGVTAGSGIVAESKADVEIEDVLVKDANGVAIDVSDSKVVVRRASLVGGATSTGAVEARSSTVTIESSAAVDARGFAIGSREGSSVTMNEVLVRGTRHRDGIAYAGIAYGGTLDVRGSAIVETTGTGLLVFGTNSKATVERSILRGTRIAPGGMGIAVLAENGGELAFTRSVVTDSDALGVIVKGGKATLADALVEKTKHQGDGASGFALVVFEKGSATIERAGFVDNAITAVVVGDGTVVATNVTAAHTQDDPKAPAGRGFSVQESGSLELSRALLVDNAESGVAVFPSSTARVSESTIEATRKTYGEKHGHGALCVDGRLDLDGVTISKQPGIGAAYARGTGVVRRARILDNAVGIHVQNGSVLVTATGETEPSQGEVVVSDDSVFAGNESRVGSGEIPLPDTTRLPK